MKETRSSFGGSFGNLSIRFGSGKLKGSFPPIDPEIRAIIKIQSWYRAWRERQKYLATRI
jgi:hypothetical protein